MGGLDVSDASAVTPVRQTIAGAGVQRLSTRNSLVPTGLPSSITSTLYSPGGNPSPLCRWNSVAAASLYEIFLVGSLITRPPKLQRTVSVPSPAPVVSTDR